MSISYMNSEILYHSFIAGAWEVIRNKKSLNAINVFPVADGDTGNNLATTMHTIIEEAKVLQSVQNTMGSIADAVLTGARGNSGIIVAQYINGIFISLRDEEPISIGAFAESVKNAVPHAYKAIANPVEGTIITVIKEWAEAVYRHKDHAENFYDLLHPSMETAVKSLKETTSKLKILEEFQVVDSGAKGFVCFLEGFTDFLRTGRLKEDLVLMTQETFISEEHVLAGGVPLYRYCTEALLTQDKLDHDRIKKALANLGDSLIVAGNERKARIHLHTDHPEQVFQVLRKSGTLLQQKADDMLRQYEAAHSRKYPIALVTDSIADLPATLMDQYQIHMVPLNLHFEGSNYLDKLTMTPEVFYSLLDHAEDYPTSAQPNQKSTDSFFSFLANHYEEIIVISLAKVQSGTYNVFLKAAEKLREQGKKISVIDSKQNSGAEGLLVLKAAEMIHNGTPYDDVVREIERLRANTRILVSLNTLKYMVRSGRINKTTGLAGKLLNLKPVASLDSEGKGVIAAKAFSLKGNTQKILRILQETNQRSRITRYAIVHADASDRAEEFRRACMSLLKKEPVYVMNISTIVGMSAGVGSVAVAYLCEQEGDEV